MDQLAIPYPVTDANDDPVSGALLYVYRTGTTTLSTDIYQDDDASAAHVNPVVCDSAGRPPQVFFNGGYAVRVRATTPAGATIFDHDPVPRVSSSTAAASAISFVPMATNSATNLQEAVENVQQDVDGYALSAGTMAGGSAVEPGLRFNNDTDTGFYRPAADQLALSEGGVDRGRLYGRKNIVGTVAQASGVPTGAIVESGRNGTNEYVRWADGTQICTSRVTTTTGTSVTWTYLAAFNDTHPIRLFANVDSSSVPQFGGAASVTGGTTANVSSWTTGGVRSSALVNVFAIGRWF